MPIPILKYWFTGLINNRDVFDSIHDRKNDRDPEFPDRRSFFRSQSDQGSYIKFHPFSY